MATEYIYFDLGKVILEFDHLRGCQQVAAVAGISSGQVEEAMFGSGLEVEFETGLMSPSEFAERFFEASGGQCEPAKLFQSMSDIFTRNEPIFPLIRNLASRQFPIGILSNTCWAHWDLVCREYAIINECFSANRILSFEVRSMKPDRKIYQAAIDAAGKAPGDIFFVDDRPENVAGAMAAGLDAVLYESVELLQEQLDKRGVSTTL